jgi:RNA polymerase sigma-70 factor (family 1)
MSQGSNAAFREIYSRYYDTIYGLGKLYLKDPVIAEDVVQTVFLRLWERRAQLPSLGSFTDWFYTVTRHELLETLRKQSAADNYRQYIKTRFQEGVDPHEGQSDVIDSVTFELIQEAIGQLTSQQQTAFRLQREKGMSYEQIAAQMGIAVNTVRRHLYLAMQSIRAYVRDHAVSAASLVWLLTWMHH